MLNFLLQYLGSIFFFFLKITPYVELLGGYGKRGTKKKSNHLILKLYYLPPRYEGLCSESYSSFSLGQGRCPPCLKYQTLGMLIYRDTH